MICAHAFFTIATENAAAMPREERWRVATCCRDKRQRHLGYAAPRLLLRDADYHVLLLPRFATYYARC